MEYTQHYSVLKEECLEHLYEGTNDTQEDLLFADLTFGGGGHSLEIVRRNSRANLISFDQDPEALKNGRQNIINEGFQDRLHLIDSNFENFKDVIEEKFGALIERTGGFDGVMMDLGVSSHHFDSGERGFSFRVDAELDMRMDSDNPDVITAKEIINTYSEQDLFRIFKEYGEERNSRRIASRIIEHREEAPIETTFQLAELVKKCYPPKLRYGKINPATKCFQALRIEVNRELVVLTNVIPQILPLLKINGKIVVITFHSLEDRIVKHEFKRMEKEYSDPYYEIMTKKPILPSEKELQENSRSRSAKLRVIKKVETRKSKNKYSHFSKVE